MLGLKKAGRKFSRCSFKIEVVSTLKRRKMSRSLFKKNHDKLERGKITKSLKKKKKKKKTRKLCSAYRPYIVL